MQKHTYNLSNQFLCSVRFIPYSTSMFLTGKKTQTSTCRLVQNPRTSLAVDDLSLPHYWIKSSPTRPSFHTITTDWTQSLLFVLLSQYLPTLVICILLVLSSLYFIPLDFPWTIHLIHSLHMRNPSCLLVYYNSLPSIYLFFLSSVPSHAHMVLGTLTLYCLNFVWPNFQLLIYNLR